MISSSIGAFYFFYFAVVAVHIIFMPKVLDMVGFSPSQIGIIFATAPLVRFIVPFAFLRGLKLERSTFNAALGLLLAGTVGFYPALNSFWALMACNITLGIGLSLTLPYVEVIALEHIGKERYGKIRLFGSIGFILVALVLVTQLHTPQTAVIYLIGSALVTVWIGYRIGGLSQHQETQALPSVSATSLLGHPWLWLGMLLMQVSFGPFYNFFTIYTTDHGVTLDMTIYLWSFGVIVEIVMFYFQGPLLRRNLLLVVQLCAGATALRWLLVHLYPDDLPLLFLSQSIHALSFALFHTAAISHLYHLYAHRKLAQQFFFGIAYGLGGFIGAFGAGYIYEYWPQMLFAAASLTALLAAAAFRGAAISSR